MKARLPAVAATALLLMSCGGSTTSTRPAAAAPSAQATPSTTGATAESPALAPPVVVSIIIDQFPAWMFDERIDKLPESGGFARLRKGGTVVRDLRMPHACADTGPGHALLYSGAVPKDSGVVSNELPGEPLGARVDIVTDAQTRLITASGSTDRPGSSLAVLRVQTVGDALRARWPQAAIVGISRKDRGAMFGAGRAPDAALWYDGSTGTFVTSTAFAPAYPAWAVSAASPTISGLQWDLLDPAFVRRNARTPDAQPGEGDVNGLGITFPHRLDTSKSPAKAYRATPFVDESVMTLGLLALARVRRPDQPMLLALSLSAMDAVGHAFGPDSWESWDELLRLDGMLAHLLGELDRQVGSTGYAVVLSSDHGMVGLPELARNKELRPWCFGGPPDRWKRPCVAGERMMQEALAHELDRAARAVVGPGDWIRGVADPYVFLTDSARQLPPAKRATLDKSISQVLMGHPGMERTIRVSDLPSTCPERSDESVAALVCRAVAPGVSGDIYMVPRDGSFFDPDYDEGKGASHGTPWVHDRAVPMLAYAPGRIAAGVTIDEPTDAAAFPRTVSALLGIEPPEHATGGLDLVMRGVHVAPAIARRQVSIATVVSPAICPHVVLPTR